VPPGANKVFRPASQSLGFSFRAAPSPPRKALFQKGGNSRDLFGSKDIPAHNVLLAHDVYILEYICNTPKLKDPECFLIVAPLKLRGLEASPTRVFAVEGMGK
jgi:kynurenine formamidase